MISGASAFGALVYKNNDCKGAKMDNEILRKMDEAGNAAERELRATVETTKKEDLAEALFKWYQKWYMKAGYKRLGRVLVMLAKEYEAQNGR